VTATCLRSALGLPKVSGAEPVKHTFSSNEKRGANQEFPVSGRRVPLESNPKKHVFTVGDLSDAHSEKLSSRNSSHWPALERQNRLTLAALIWLP